MRHPNQIQYTAVPEWQSWLIPRWDGRDWDEFNDLASSIRYRGPERFHEAVLTFERAANRSGVVGVLFYVGSNLPDRVTLPLAPDTQAEAVDILSEAVGFMAKRRGVVPWEQIRSQLWAIREVVSKSDGQRYPSFGFSAVVQSQHGYTEAPTDWIAERSD